MSQAVATATAKPAEVPPSVVESKVPWSVGLGIVVVVVVYFVAQFAASIAVSLYPWLRHWSNAHAQNWLNGSVIAQFLFVLLAESLTVGLILLFMRHYKAAWRLIGLRRPRWLDAGWGLLAFPFYLVAFGVIVNLLGTFIPSFSTNQKQEIGFDSVHGFLPLSLTFISLVILPPIAEEIMVRGFLFSSLKKTLPAIWAALLTSVIFASAHISESSGGGGFPYTLVFDTFTLSLVLCYLRQKTGSLWAGITLHALKNGVAYISLFLLTNR